MATQNKGEYLCRKLCSGVCIVYCSVCVRERERERVVCVCTEIQDKICIFHCGSQSAHLKVTDVEDTNGAKQKSIANGFPGERDAVQCGFPEDVWE